ncbi:hypothetical protein G7047_04920 [Diaphorobacter sp. HDW4A]|uniref:hypothetical protein n=1 Tax=Diaphorobacter sp. HDW4A TaxID=2714924 RepID=UPI001409AB2F|nr:hypothetical protein [Diaphorobacter sp. HDW4A]QIL79320.1 hypothetical protein G7047_04920 [Diaphorobacter sp. HDW4A]
MIELPIYRALDIAPGQRYFDCLPLRASLSTSSCAQRWAAAETSSQCHACELGRAHHADHNLDKRPGLRKTDANVGACFRCGRTDLRIIKVNGLCVSCSNREAEWRKGRNGKGKPPITFKPLHSIEVAVQRPDASHERHLVQALHDAEALGRVLRNLPAGGRLQTSERRVVAWNAATSAFEHVCERCGTAGLILERMRGEGALERHAWCCNGEPVGAGWCLAEVRRLPFALDAEAAAVWLNTDPDVQEPGDAWVPTAYPCKCGAGLIEGLLTKPARRWNTRCRACGDSSTNDPMLGDM